MTPCLEFMLSQVPKSGPGAPIRNKCCSTAIDQPIFNAITWKHPTDGAAPLHRARSTPLFPSHLRVRRIDHSSRQYSSLWDFGLLPSERSLNRGQAPESRTRRKTMHDLLIALAFVGMVIAPAI